MDNKKHLTHTRHPYAAMAQGRHGGVAQINVSLAQRTWQIILKNQCEAPYLVTRTSSGTGYIVRRRRL